jgi:hypothetical protein
MSEDRYRYTRADIERVRPSQLQPGDLIVHAGPPGTGRFSADPVTFVGWAGYSPLWGDDTYRVEYRRPWGVLHFVNPDRMHVWRLTDTARHRSGVA